MKIGRKKPACEVPSTAMGDIAFNLIVFFVILARAQDDSHLQWQAASTPKVEPAGYAKVSLVVDTKNKLYFNGKEMGVGELSDAITKHLGNSPQGQRTVLLKIHNQTLAQRFEPIIEAVSQAGGELVHVLDEDKQK